MYKLRNATIWCGGPVPGGEDCADCPDGMPPAFTISGAFPNGTCNECDAFDGLTIDQNVGCVYHVGGSCGDVDLTFSTNTIHLEVLGLGVHYTKSRSASDPCNTAHTLTLASGGGETTCDWPDSITVTPSL